MIVFFLLFFHSYNYFGQSNCISLTKFFLLFYTKNLLFSILHCYFSKILTVVHLFYNALYLNNNFYYFFLFLFLFCSYLFIFSFVLIFFSLSLSHLAYQSFVPLLFLLLPSTVTSPSSFQGHNQITSLHKHLLLLFPLMVKSLIHHKHQSPP